MKVSYVFPNVAAWLVCIDASICSRGHVWLVVHHDHANLLGADACKAVPLHQYWPVSQAKGIKKY